MLSEQITRNRKEELKLARENRNTSYRNGMPLVDVKIDGSWSKTGFTSNFGFAVILSSRTGKVLDCHFLSKYCNRCAQLRSAGNLDAGEDCGDCRVSLKIDY